MTTKKTDRQAKISTALRGSMFTLVALIAVCSIYSMVSFQLIGKNLTTFYNVEYNTTKDQMEIRKDVQTILKRALWAAISRDASVTQEQREDFKGRFVKLESFITSIEKNLEDTALGNELRTCLGNFEDSTYQMMDLIDAGKYEDAVRYYDTDYFNISEALADVLEKTGTLSDGAAQEKYDKNLSIQYLATVILAVLTAIAVILALVLVNYLTKRIVSPVANCAKRLHILVQDGDLHTAVPESPYRDETGMMLQDMDETIRHLYQIVTTMSEHLQAIASGDLSKEVDFSYEGDFAPLADSLQTIYGSLNHMMGQINQSADQVALGSDQVSSGAQSLSQGATEQASSVEELAATVNEISGNVSKNAENATFASNIATALNEKAEESSQQMKEMLTAMSAINDSSSQIGKILKTIEDIAFQTNILALNAAVEAARAGAAGKGFAVVADEVRNLAGKSAEASKNTASLIEDSVSAVDQGTKIVNATAGTLGELASGVQAMAQTIMDISESSQMQAQSIDQVTQGIDQIASVVQTTSATAEESAAASEQLSGQAQTFKDLVGRFKLR